MSIFFRKSSFEDIQKDSGFEISKEKYGFKKGGLVKQGKPKLAKKGWR